MKKQTLFAGLSMVAIAAFVACANTTPQPDPNANVPTCPATINIGPGNTYSPAKCKVTVGTSVTIQAQSAHPLLGLPGANNPIPSTPPQGQTGYTADQTYTFAQTGTFGYRCVFHGGVDGSGMAGQIIVVAN